MAEKANHHVVPQFYLRSFANGEGRQARITGFDKETAESFVTNVRNVGGMRHFNRIAVPGQDPNALENMMSEIEGEWAPLFREVVEAGGFPSSLHREGLLTLITTLSLRTGRIRAVLHDLM
jgi:hypothetical protein